MFAIGKLVKILLADGAVISFTEEHTVLAYNKATNDLLITEVSENQDSDRKDGHLAGDREHFYRFHSNFPVGSIMVDWFAKSRRAKDVGLIRWINYFVPPEYSSSKSGKEFKHAFGDVGDRKKEYPEDLMPMLAYDRGLDWWYIVRRPSNIWTVDDYIRG